MLKHTVVRNGEAHLLLAMQHALLRYHRILKKLHEMKLGAHIGHVYSLSVGRRGEKYYLMIGIDGIE